VGKDRSHLFLKYQYEFETLYTLCAVRKARASATQQNSAYATSRKYNGISSLIEKLFPRKKSK